MSFTKTMGGVNPWGMFSDGDDCVCISPKVKKWERRKYHKGSRREALTIIRKALWKWNE